MNDLFALAIVAAVFAVVWFAVHAKKRSPDGTFSGGVRRIFRLK